MSCQQDESHHISSWLHKVPNKAMAGGLQGYIQLRYAGYITKKTGHPEFKSLAGN